MVNLDANQTTSVTAFPARHEAFVSGDDVVVVVVGDESSQSSNVGENNDSDPNATPCMPLNESFQDRSPPITECFKCDVEEYEHEHEIGPYKDHHHSHLDESACDGSCELARRPTLDRDLAIDDETNAKH